MLQRGNAMTGSWGINPVSFVRRYRPATRDALEQAFPHGCLLTSHDPAAEAQGGIVYPLLKGAQALVESSDPEAGCITMGRGPANDLIVVHPTVSKTHAHFALGNGRLCVVDRSSANGTFVRGARLEPQRPVFLEAGVTELLFGEARLFRFDASSLFDYLAGLSFEPGADAPVRPVDHESTATTTSRAGRIPALDVQTTHHVDLRGPEAERAAAQEKWTRATDSLLKLLPRTQRVEIFLAVNPKPVPIYLAESGAAPAAVLKNLESLRWVIERIKVTFKQNKGEMVLYER
jgi:hypothetical protein